MKLRTLEEDDLVAILELRNHPEIRKYMFNNNEIPLSSHLSWYEKNKANSDLIIYVYEDENHNIIGSINLTFDPSHTVAEWGFYLKPNLPKGSGTKMLSELIEYLKQENKLNILTGKVLLNNIASQKVHEKLHFQETKRSYLPEYQTQIIEYQLDLTN